MEHHSADGLRDRQWQTVFGHAYQRLNQTRTLGAQSLPDPANAGAVGTVTGKTFFQSDIYGSPIFASDGQGVLQQYAEYDIWGGLNAGAESQAGSGSRGNGAFLPGLEENLRFTSYQYDPVIGKYFAQARFYDGANGRMLGKDPVKRGLNPYRYCDDDPVDYVDPTREILNIIGGAVLGGVFGGAGGLISSAIFQKISGGKVNWKEAWGAAANGAITGAAQGGLLASGAGIPVALATNFLAGTAGSAAEQYIGTGRVDTRKSITNGLNNAVSNLIYGTNPLGSVKEAFGRGFGAGAATSAINYISDLMGQKPVGSGVNAELLSGITGAAVSPFAAMRDPRRGCGSASPFTFSLGYGTAKGYRYDTPQTTNQPQSQRRGFSLKAFLGETLLGGLTGGFTSVAFYGAGKGIEKLVEGFQSFMGNNYRGQQYKGTRNPEVDFVNKRGVSTISRHANDHGYRSPEEYLRDARRFLEKKPTLTTQSFVSKEGTYFRYDTRTNEFGIINAYGGISTYFRPDNKMAYWLEQIEQYAPK